MSSVASKTSDFDIKNSVGAIEEVLAAQLPKVEGVVRLDESVARKFAARFACYKVDINRLRCNQYAFEPAITGLVARLNMFIRKYIQADWRELGKAYVQWMNIHGTPEPVVDVLSPASSPLRAPDARSAIEDEAEAGTTAGGQVVGEGSIAESLGAKKKGGSRVKSKAVVEDSDDNEESAAAKEPATPTRPKLRPAYAAKEKGKGKLLIAEVVLDARPNANQAAPTPAASAPGEVAEEKGRKRKAREDADGEKEKEVKRRKGQGITEAYATFLIKNSRRSDVIYKTLCSGCSSSSFNVCVGSAGEAKCHGCAFKHRACEDRSKHSRPRYPDAGPEFDPWAGFEEGIAELDEARKKKEKETEVKRKGKGKEREVEGEGAKTGGEDDDDEMDVEEVPPPLVRATKATKD
ncbi:hypothetical protein BDZ94DRAFT_1310488, partial [Collybia nuda]